MALLQCLNFNLVPLRSCKFCSRLIGDLEKLASQLVHLSQVGLNSLFGAGFEDLYVVLKEHDTWSASQATVLIVSAPSTPRLAVPSRHLPEESQEQGHQSRKAPIP